MSNDQDEKRPGDARKDDGGPPAAKVTRQQTKIGQGHGLLFCFRCGSPMAEAEFCPNCGQRRCVSCGDA